MKHKHIRGILLKATLFFSTLYSLVLLFFIQFMPNFSEFTAIILIPIFALFMFLLLLFENHKITPLLAEKDNCANMNRILYHLLYKSVHANNKEELYQHILDSAIEAIPIAQKGSIMLLNEETGLLNFVAAKGYDLEKLRNTFIRLEQTYLYLESKGIINRTVVIHDPFGYDRKNLNEKNIEQILDAGTDNVMSTLSTPIIFNDKLHGMINIESKYVDAFTISDQTTSELFALEIMNVIKLFTFKEQLTYVSNHDSLTKTYNRNYFNEIIPDQLSLAKENNYPLILVSIDLNNLKRSNDSYGHECGDLLLAHFTSCFQKNLPQNTYFFRYGGDEFFLLLPDYTKDAAEALITALSALLREKPLQYNDSSIELSFCYGIAVFPTERTDIDGLMRLADERMYQQKRQYHFSLH